MNNHHAGSSVALRAVVLLSALYFAYAAWTLGSRWLIDGVFLAAFLAYALLTVFLVVPPRVLVRGWWAAVPLALPFPTWWLLTLLHEGFRGADIGGVLLLHVPLAIQVARIVSCRTRPGATHVRRAVGAGKELVVSSPE